MLLFSAIIIVIAVLGYKVIHKLGKLASIIGILAFVYMFVTPADVGGSRGPGAK